MGRPDKGGVRVKIPRKIQKTPKKYTYRAQNVFYIILRGFNGIVPCGLIKKKQKKNLSEHSYDYSTFSQGCVSVRGCVCVCVCVGRGVLGLISLC